MAKKEENKRTGDKDQVEKAADNKKSKKKASGTPEKSGKVKGPTGVGGKKKPTTDAEVKKPSKVNQPARGRTPSTKKPQKASSTGKDIPSKKEDPSQENSSIQKSLPEKTSNGEEHLTVIDQGKAEKTTGIEMEEKPAPKKKRAAKSPKKTEPTNTSTSKGAKKPKETKAKKAKATKEANAEKGSIEEPKFSAQEKKAPAKKMSRRKSVEGISAEEKMKRPNSSTKDTLKEKATTTFKSLMDKVIPDEETQQELTEILKTMLPDQEQINRTAGKIVENLQPDSDKLDELLEKIPNEKIREQVRAAVLNIQKEKKKHTPEKKAEDIPTEPAEASLISEFDIHLFKEGKHFHLYKKMGSHIVEFMGTTGVYFALWAPNAESVSVIGDFNNWDRSRNAMSSRPDDSGIWEIFIPEASKGSLYKYFIRSSNGYEAEKGDPFAFMWETPPNTASIVWDINSSWNDSTWMEQRKEKPQASKAMSVYELHIGSWKRVPEEDMRSLTYREMAEQLPGYLEEMGFTHVEFMPVMEHPFFGSWGYQITGYFAPSSRFGTPQDFMYLIDALHQRGIGVILDWVPSHFPSDLHGLHYFDGTFLYEHADPQKGFHPDWQSYIFNYGRNEVRSFLISNALFWLDKFHVDGLRVDAVASMLYLDYSRKEGEWQPNEFGGRENLEAISFLKEFNETVYKEFPDIVTIAEESTAWPMVSKPTYIGGLGFGMKWMMGWMHDTLEYFQKDPIHRKHHQNTITFSTTYAFTENFMLPLSHDEVVYGKQSIWNKMPGDSWNKFANLRCLYAYMFAHPGAKLLFMGSEFGQTTEWDHDSSLHWHLTNEEPHRQTQKTIAALNHLYKTEPALYEISFEGKGFEWVDYNDAENSIISFLRKGNNPNDDILVICNFTPVPRENYRLGISGSGTWKEIFNSDAQIYGGSGVSNDTVELEPFPTHGKDSSIALNIPPIASIYLKKEM